MTPGRFKGWRVCLEKGAVTEQDYLSIGDTAFIKSSLDKILSAESLREAQRIFPLLDGAYVNRDMPQWGTLYFESEQVGDTTVLKAKLDKDAEYVPLYVVSASETKIELTGHDWQPTDKMHCFYLEGGVWKYVCSDLVSTNLHLDYRTR